MEKGKRQKQYSKELKEKWKKQEEEQKRKHKELAKDMLLDYVKGGCTTLSDFNEQTQMYPLNCMSVKELTEYLNENGYKVVAIKDLLFVKME